MSVYMYRGVHLSRRFTQHREESLYFYPIWVSAGSTSQQPTRRISLVLRMGASGPSGNALHPPRSFLNKEGSAPPFATVSLHEHREREHMRALWMQRNTAIGDHAADQSCHFNYLHWRRRNSVLRCSVWWILLHRQKYCHALGLRMGTVSLEWVRDKQCHGRIISCACIHSVRYLQHIIPNIPIRSPLPHSVYYSGLWISTCPQHPLLDYPWRSFSYPFVIPTHLSSAKFSFLLSSSLSFLSSCLYGWTLLSHDSPMIFYEMLWYPYDHIPYSSLFIQSVLRFLFHTFSF